MKEESGTTKFTKITKIPFLLFLGFGPGTKESRSRSGRILCVLERSGRFDFFLKRRRTTEDAEKPPRSANAVKVGAVWVFVARLREGV